MVIYITDVETILNVIEVEDIVPGLRHDKHTFVPRHLRTFDRRTPQRYSKPFKSHSTRRIEFRILRLEQTTEF